MMDAYKVRLLLRLFEEIPHKKYFYTKGDIFMTKQDMIEQIAEKEKITKAAAGRIINMIAEDIQADLIREGTAIVPGVGTLRRQTQKARICRNPQTGGTVNVPEKQTVKFRASQALKAAVN